MLDLGVVTAYAYAVEGGYTGTEEEFTALLGNIAIDLSEIENLSVTVTTLPAGSSATASYSDGVLSLGIPKGDKGDQGDQGETGPTGATPQLSIGTVTTGVAGSDAAVTITGTAENPVMNLTIPRGNSGDEGLLATAYSSSSTYAVGDYCIYNDILYRCTTAISTAEAWTAAHWAAVTVGDELSDLKAEMSNLFKYTYSQGVYILRHLNSSGNITTNNNKNCVFGEPVVALKGSTMYVDSGYKYMYALYNINTGVFISRSSWITGTTVTTLNDDYLIRIEISDTSESVLADTSISAHLHYTLYASKEFPFEVNDIVFASNCNVDLNYEVGDTVDLTPAFVSTYRYAIVECQENDLFVINATGGTNPRVWAFVDSNNRLLLKAHVSTSGQAQTNLFLVAPENASKLIINDQKTGGTCTKFGIVKTHTYWIKQIKDDHINNYQADEILTQTSNLINALGISAFAGKTVTICEANKYTAWPFVGTTDNKAVCVYSRNTQHENDSTSAIYSKASKDGIIWSLEQRIIDTEADRDTITGKGNNSDGDMIFWNRVGSPFSNYYELYKTSDGITFTKVSKQTFSPVVGHMGDIISVPTVGLVSFYNTFGSTRTWGMAVSADDGETWTLTPIESNISDSECPTEISGAYVSDGKILAIGRKDASSGTHALFQIESSDYGSTWTKEYTNIDDIYSSTPSLIYDSTSQLLSLFYYQRGIGALRMRRNMLSEVWNNPTGWNASNVIAHGSTSLSDAGNVNAVMFKTYQIVSFYSGDSTNTGIYATIE